MTAIVNGVTVIGTPEEIRALLLSMPKSQQSNYDSQVCDNQDRPDYSTHLRSNLS